MEKEKFDKIMDHTKKAFEDVIFELVSSGYQLTQEDPQRSSHKLAIIIGITGNSKGRILLECDVPTANKFAVAMNDGDPLEEGPNAFYMYIAEFANMICGRAVTYINNEFKQREVWLAPPAIFSGEDLEIVTPSVLSEKVNYTGEIGEFTLDVGFGG